MGFFLCIVVCLVAFLAPLHVEANLFHQVNDFDIHGKQCVPPTFTGLECPLLCTTDISLCPSSIRPSCPPNQSFCPHGECVPNPNQLPLDQVCPLSSASPLCSCSQEHPKATSNLNVDQLWLPCISSTQTRFRIDLPPTLPQEKETKFNASCYAAIENQPLLTYLTCNSPAPQFTYLEPIWLSFWTALACEGVLLGVFAILKYSLQKKTTHTTSVQNKPSSTATFGSSSHSISSLIPPLEGCYPIDTPDSLQGNQKENETEKETERPSKSKPSLPFQQERLVFYQNHVFGHVAFYMTLIYTLFIFIFLEFIIADYYTTLDSPAQFFVDATLIPSTFIYVWHWMVFLLILWKVKTPLAVRQFFRIRTLDPLKADYVMVHRPIQKIRLAPLPKNILPCLRALVHYLHRLEHSIQDRFGFSIQSSCHQIHLTKHHQVPFFYDTGMRYMYSSTLKTFRPHALQLATSLGGLIQLAHSTYEKGGLNALQVNHRLEWIGPNRIVLKPPNFFKLLAQEFSGWFYMYQFVMLQVWYYFLYWKMGLILTLFILTSALIKSWVRFKAYRRIQRLVATTSNVSVLREQKFTQIEETQLVPGDILTLSNVNTTLTVDVLVIKGQVLVNESCLTGESKPITKAPIPSDLMSFYSQVPLDLHLHQHHILFAGTSILQADKLAYGIVLTTQLHSSRGHLIQKLLRPIPTVSAFHDQLKVVLLFLLIWGSLCFSMVVYFMWDGTSTAWFYAVFMITEIISPLLPAVLVAGQSVAANRLTQHQITCTDLERIALAGKTKFFCFDKTGTLTQTQLVFSHFLSYRPKKSKLVDTEGSMKDPLGHKVHSDQIDYFKDASDLNDQETLGFLTCHSLTVFDHKIVGHPVECALFEFINSSESYSNSFELVGDSLLDNEGRALAVIVHRYPFENELQSMGVVIKLPMVSDPIINSTATLTNPTYTIYFKGAYEKIKSQCVHVPTFFDDAWRKASKAGGYVLALATRTSEVVPQHRHEAMQQLTFLGLLAFQNPLKQDSQDVVRTLQQGGCQTIMITGDALFTGVHVAKECGFLPILSPLCAYGDVDPNQENELIWRNIETEQPIDVVTFLSKGEGSLNLAITGAAWDCLMQRDLVSLYLNRIKVFARMAPDQKTQVVQAFMKQGVVAMCGDGANDCGALHTATVGIALSDSESALVAPFATSCTTSLNACVRVLTEGRAALASSFAGYKFLIMYGMTMSAMCLMMYYFQIVLPQWIWISIDGVIVVASCITLTRAKSLTTLAPQRPTMNLLGFQTIGSIALHTFFNWSFLMIAIYCLFQQAWFLCNEFDPFAIDLSKWWLLGDNYEGSVISIMVIFQYINNGFRFNFGDRFRKSWYTNTVYVGFYLLAMIFFSCIVLLDPFYLNCTYRINCGNPEELVKLGYPKPSFDIAPYNSLIGHNVMPHDFRRLIWGLAMANALVCLIVEKWGVLGYFRQWASKKSKTN